MKQVWQAKEVLGGVILGMMSGYISLGLVAYFDFWGIELLYPAFYVGIPVGDISPISFPAQKLVVLTALLGQFYLVIITAVVIGKFCRTRNKD